MKKVSQGTIVNEVVNVGGVSKENAVNIFNIFSNAWSLDRIGLLKALDTGINVKRARKQTKKVTKKATPIKATKKTETKKKTSTFVAKVKVKAKSKKKLKKSKSSSSNFHKKQHKDKNSLKIE